MMKDLAENGQDVEREGVKVVVISRGRRGGIRVPDQNNIIIIHQDDDETKVFLRIKPSFLALTPVSCLV